MKGFTSGRSSLQNCCIACIMQRKQRKCNTGDGRKSWTFLWDNVHKSMCARMYNACEVERQAWTTPVGLAQTVQEYIRRILITCIHIHHKISTGVYIRFLLRIHTVFPYKYVYIRSEWVVQKWTSPGLWDHKKQSPISSLFNNCFCAIAMSLVEGNPWWSNSSQWFNSKGFISSGTRSTRVLVWAGHASESQWRFAPVCTDAHTKTHVRAKWKMHAHLHIYAHAHIHACMYEL